MEDIRRFNEASRLIHESTRNLAADSSTNEIAKLLMFQIVSNLFQGKRSAPTKKRHFLRASRSPFVINVCQGVV